MLPLRPVELAAAADLGPMRVTARGPGGPEFVMDYALVGASADNYVFQSDTTYLVTSTANLYGKVVFEAGTVVKFTGYTGGYYLYLVDPAGSFAFNGTATCPTVFTDMDDDSVGSRIGWSTGVPSQGWLIICRRRRRRRC
jgi:hypothetical protein